MDEPNQIESHRPERPKISIVLPCHNEQDNVAGILAAIAAENLEEKYALEIIFVDDGSTDATWTRIKELVGSHSNAAGLRLSRNFGQQAALLAGLSTATGQAVISMDSDLQHPASLLPTLLERWHQGAEVVTTTRIDNQRTPWHKRFTATLFYNFFSLLTGLPLGYGQADYRLLDRKVVQAILSCPEGNLFLRGLISWIGFRQDNVEYEVQQRQAGGSKYSLRKMLVFGLDAAFSFSSTPLRMGLSLGIGVTALAFAYGFYAIVVRLFYHESFGELVPGWASLAALISFLFGLLFVQLGLLGEYLARVYTECKGRPRYIVAQSAGISSAKD